MKLVVVNLAFAADLLGPDDLLTRYHSLVGWADALTQAGASVTVVQAFTHDEHRHRRGVDYIFCRTRRSSFLPDDGVRAAVQAAEPDVVHVNGLDAPMQAWWLRRALAPAAALVVQDHAGTPTRPGTLRASLRRRAMRAPDAFLFTTWEQAAPWLEGGFIREAWRVQTVLEASTTVEPIEPSRARAQVGLTGAPAIVWVGRLTPNKDPLVVLEGIERAAAVLPDLTAIGRCLPPCRTG